MGPQTDALSGVVQHEVHFSAFNASLGKECLFERGDLRLCDL